MADLEEKESPLGDLGARWSRLVLDSISEGLMVVDQEFKITWFNRAAQEITGVPREEALGSFCFEVLRAEVCETACPIKDSWRRKRPVSGRKVHLLRADGTRVPVEIRAVPFLRSDGSVAGGAEIFRDVTLEEALKEAARGKESLGGMVGRSPAAKKVFHMITKMARTNATVLIQGESGTGKELAARALHDMGPRARGPFVAINLAAIPEALVESELFGHEPGAFTGAVGRREGALARASGGTLFLDEVGEIPLSLQPKLLRFLEDQTFTPLGGKEPVKVDVRIVAATNRDLEEMVRQGRFRKDLYFRLAVLVLEIPPLRERPQDIPLLAEHFLEVISRLRGRKTAGWSPEAMEALMNYSWPGNVRELRSTVETAVLFCPPGGPILPEHLPQAVLRKEPPAPSAPVSRPRTLKEIEEAAILEALERNKGGKEKTAKELGIHRVTLYRKLREMDREGKLGKKGEEDEKDPSPGGGAGPE